MKKTLHLILTLNWFDMIKRKVKPKKEEYRKITPYWCARFLLFLGKKKSIKFWKSKTGVCSDLYTYVRHGLRVGVIEFIYHDTITFSNGMTPPVPRFEIDKKGISIGEGNPDWGAIPGKEYFVLELGDLV